MINERNRFVSGGSGIYNQSITVVGLRTEEATLVSIQRIRLTFEKWKWKETTKKKTQLFSS